MATFNLPARTTSCNNAPVGRLLSIGRASREYGVSIQSLRNWTNTGKLTTYLSPGGHRRLSPVDLSSLIGDNNTDNDGPQPVCYCRVSNVSQKEALPRQIKEVRAEVAMRENIPEKDITIFSDVASSFGSRKGLNELVLLRKVKAIYSE